MDITRQTYDLQLVVTDLKQQYLLMDDMIADMVQIEDLLSSETFNTANDNYEAEFLNSMVQEQELTQLQIIQLYAILIDKNSDEVMNIMFNIKLVTKLWEFVNNIQPHGLHLELLIYEYVIQLIKTILNQGSQLNDLEVQFCVETLQEIYNITSQAYYRDGIHKINRLFVQCLGVLYKNGREIAIPLYIEMLAEQASSLEQFFYLFKKHLYLPTSSHNVKDIQKLMRGLAIRLPIVMQDFDTWKHQLRNTFSALIIFLGRHSSSNYWLNYLATENEPIIMETLVEFCSKNAFQDHLAYLMEKLIESYRVSQLKPSTKYTFIIKLFKSILSSSSLLFSMMSTSAISDDREFLCWFMEHEVTIEKGEEVTQIYMGNKFALEFFVAMLIYYLYHYPQRKGQVKYLTDNFHLLEQAKPHMAADTVKDLLHTYHEHIEDEDNYETFLNSVLDAATTFEL